MGEWEKSQMWESEKIWKIRKLKVWKMKHEKRGEVGNNWNEMNVNK